MLVMPRFLRSLRASARVQVKHLSFSNFVGRQHSAERRHTAEKWRSTADRVWRPDHLEVGLHLRSFVRAGREDGPAGEKFARGRDKEINEGIDLRNADSVSTFRELMSEQLHRPVD